MEPSGGNVIAGKSKQAICKDSHLMTVENWATEKSLVREYNRETKRRMEISIQIWPKKNEKRRGLVKRG